MSNIRFRPDHLDVLYFCGFSGITKCLFLGGSALKSLPNNLTVTEIMDIENSLIEHLPEKLKVGVNLWMRHTEIHTLPDDIKVGFTIYTDSNKLLYNTTKPIGVADIRPY